MIIDNSKYLEYIKEIQSKKETYLIIKIRKKVVNYELNTNNVCTRMTRLLIRSSYKQNIKNSENLVK